MGATAEYGIQSSWGGVGIQRRIETVVWLDRSVARKTTNGLDIGADGRIRHFGGLTDFGDNGKGGGIFAGQGKEESDQIFTKKRRKMIKVSSKRLVNRYFVVDAKQELIDTP